MTKSKAITELYALFGASHNADINLARLNKLLDELMAQPERKPMHPQIKKMYEDYFDKCFKESPAARRTWVRLSDTQIENVYYEMTKLHRGAPMPWGQIQFGKALQEKFIEVNT